MRTPANNANAASGIIGIYISTRSYQHAVALAHPQCAQDGGHALHLGMQFAAGGDTLGVALGADANQRALIGPRLPITGLTLLEQPINQRVLIGPRLPVAVYPRCGTDWSAPPRSSAQKAGGHGCTPAQTDAASRSGGPAQPTSPRGPRSSGGTTMRSRRSSRVCPRGDGKPPLMEGRLAHPRADTATYATGKPLLMEGRLARC